MRKYGVLYVNRIDDLQEQKGCWIMSDSFFNVKELFYMNSLHDDCKIIEIICEESHLEIHKGKELIHKTTHKSTFDRLLRWYKQKGVSVTIKERGNDEEDETKNGKTKR